MTGEKRAKDASSRPETLPSAPDTVASSPSLADALGATQALPSSPLGNPRHAAAPPSDSDGGSASRVAVEGSDLLTPGDSEQTDTLVATRIKQSLAPRTLPSAGAEPPAEANAKSPDRFQRRYAKRRTLGAGGMGEVILFRDQTIGRDVALKVIRDGNLHSEARMRFLREARVQGQLEHPAIVPVYDLGVDPSGNLYFTMKRLRGLSLDEVLDELRDADSDVPSARGTSFKERFSRRKLLTLFNSVCLAVHFAHSRGVLHRDLKPANIMLGDFGEVYVLDWGLAKIQGGAEDDPELQALEAQALGPAGTTVAGSLLGTPGYMSPEQARGRHADLDARSDVYALGAILFELLTLTRLHQGERLEQILASTLEKAHGAPSELDPDLPPELDMICRTATSMDLTARFPSARALSDALEAYLDGDRDVERRRELAAVHAENGAGHLRRVEAGDESARGPSMRAVTTALGLEPDNHQARTTLVQLLTRPPKDLPRGAQDRMDRAAIETHRVAAKTALLVYLGFTFYLPFPLWLGVASWKALGALALCILTCAVLTQRLIHHPPPPGRLPLLHVAVSSLTMGVASVMLGAFIIVPTIAMANVVAYVASTERRGRVWVVLASCLAVALPALGAFAGVLPETYTFEGGVMHVHPWMMNFPEIPTWIFLIVANVALVASGGYFVGRLRDDLLTAQRTLHLQAWQLEQIAPEDAQPMLSLRGSAQP